MEYFDVIFPVNLGPLTYACDKPLSAMLAPGMIVSAPLKNKLTLGIVTEKATVIPPQKMKRIHSIHSDVPVFNKAMISLLKWMSDYYMAEQGLVLKNMLPGEAFTKVKQRKTMFDKRPGFFKKSDFNSSRGRNEAAAILKAAADHAYRTFLLHAPSTTYEYALLIKLLAEMRNVVILMPEITLVQNLYPVIQGMFGERACLLHGELSSGMRSGAIDRIISGQSDIIIGTRSAVFAPLKKVSLIAVLQEHSGSYKQESTPSYHARDVAVMRGCLEKAIVLLSSICPSVESFNNCESGKYTLLKAEHDVKKPSIKIVDMRYEKVSRPSISKTAIDAAVKYIHNGKKVMFFVNRRGYSTLLQCSDCDHIEACPDCSIPLVFHKQDMSLKCHYCGYTLSKVPENCSRCKGYNLKLAGAGTQRAQEDIENIIGIKTLRVDSDTARRKSDIEGVLCAAVRDDMQIIIGTKLMTKRVGVSSGFSMAAILNADIFLHIPDFRAAEKSYQEISSIIDKIEPGGDVFIQTRMPQDVFYRYVKNYDYSFFFREEMQKRRVLLYPPFSRLILVKLISKRDLSKDLSEISKRTGNEVEIIGPYITKTARGGSEYRMLLRSPARGELHTAAKAFLEAFRGFKDVRVRVDVDPAVI